MNVNGGNAMEVLQYLEMQEINPVLIQEVEKFRQMYSVDEKEIGRASCRERV